MRRSVAALALPNEGAGNAPRYGGRTFIPNPPSFGFAEYKIRTQGVLPSKNDFVPSFVMQHNRERIRQLMEGRGSMILYSRKVPEFWKNYRMFYRIGESCREWRENKLRYYAEKVIMEDAVQCKAHDAWELVRVMDRLVTLAKDGSRSSRRILQEFFETKYWDGGREPLNWEGVGDAGDMRAMYKMLDDYPQRFKGRQGGYARMTITHTPFERKENGVLDPVRHSEVTIHRGRIAIVEMLDRDNSIFHRGQVITGDKGEDVWDHENDRPLLDIHRGFNEQPVAVQIEEKLKEQEMREYESEERYVANPQQYVGYQAIEQEQPRKREVDRKHHLYQMTYTKRFRGEHNALKKDPNGRWADLDLENIHSYIRNLHYNATQRQLYEQENFYEMFPRLSDPEWLNKIYKPYMKLSPAKQQEVYNVLENANIHNMNGTTLLTDGLPMPKVPRNEKLHDHVKRVWESKLQYLETFPYNDPRDAPLLSAAEREALEGKLTAKER